MSDPLPLTDWELTADVSRRSKNAGTEFVRAVSRHQRCRGVGERDRLLEAITKRQRRRMF
jgi:hypothetical protein